MKTAILTALETVAWHTVTPASPHCSANVTQLCPQKGHPFAVTMHYNWVSMPIHSLASLLRLPAGLPIYTPSSWFCCRKLNFCIWHSTWRNVKWCTFCKESLRFSYVLMRMLQEKKMQEFLQKASTHAAAADKIISQSRSSCAFYYNYKTLILNEVCQTHSGERAKFHFYLWSINLRSTADLPLVCMGNLYKDLGWNKALRSN